MPLDSLLTHNWPVEPRPDIARTEINGTRQRSQVDLERFRSHAITIAVAIMASALRIVSFLPSATEMACALGLAEQLVGVTHECDYPQEIKGKPIVVRSALPVESMSDQEIDRAVSERLREGQSVYRVDEQLLRELTPDLILTQDLCQVCAPSGNEVSQVLNALPYKPQILWLTPKSLDEIFDNIRQLGAATGRTEQAEALINGGRAHLDGIATITCTLRTGPGLSAWNG